MLHFFRKIRRDLIENSKSLKYLKYASGEIVLVVLGILIALGINNWNENRKYRMLEIKLLSDVSRNLLVDTLNLNSIIEHYDNVMKQAEFIKSEFERYNLPNFRKLTGFLQLFGAFGLVIGLYFNTLILFLASSGLFLLMFGGFIVRLKIKDSFIQSLPSFGFAMLNLFITIKTFSTYF